MANSICVCGAGTMGSGIAQASAQAGFHTILFDVNTNILAKAKPAIEKNLQGLVEKNKIDQNKKENILGRLSFTDDINTCIADIIIEAIIENTKAKTDLFSQLSPINKPETIFATNTS